MRRYRVNIFAKQGESADIYRAEDITADDLQSAKASAEVIYREYELSAIRLGSKHTAMFYELFEDATLVYSSNPSNSISTAIYDVWKSLQRLNPFRSKT